MPVGYDSGLGQIEQWMHSAQIEKAPEKALEKILE
jgi:hypothetical protein